MMCPESPEGVRSSLAGVPSFLPADHIVYRGAGKVSRAPVTPASHRGLCGIDAVSPCLARLQLQ